MKPIIFDTESVRAILAGRKTQTRQVMKPQPTIDADGMWHWKDCQWMDGGIGFPASGIADHAPHKAGDVLYAKERAREFSGMTYCWQGGAYIPAFDFSGWNYAADDEHMRTDEGCWGEMFLPSEDAKTDISYDKWHSPIHMPREAARIFLRTKSVRTERLQVISERDALDEGVSCCQRDENKCRNLCVNRSFGCACFCPTTEYMHLWDSKNAKKGYLWESNCWVWVYEFERIEKEEAERTESS